MPVEFPSDIDKINDTDFDILRCLYGSGAMWKMKITRRINRRRSEGTLLDLKKSISKQAVARRVDRLHDLDYLQNSIVTADGSKGQKFVLGFSTTERGEEELEKAVRRILRDVVAEKISRENMECERLDEFLELYRDLTGNDPEDLVEFVEKELDEE